MMTSYVILGQGKSGTTAVMSAVCSALEWACEVVFEPKSQEQLEAELEGTHSEHVVVKQLIDHCDHEEMLSSLDYKMFLCRDPRDVTISRFLYRSRDMKGLRDAGRLEELLGLLERKEADPASISMSELMKRQAEIAGERNQLDHLRAVHEKAVAIWDRLQGSDTYWELVRYEEFVDGNVRGLERLLGTSVTGNVSVPEEWSRVERTKRSASWKDWFTSADIEWANRSFGHYMSRFSYSDWTLSDHPRIEPSESSQYVRRIMGKGGRGG